MTYKTTIPIEELTKHTGKSYSVCSSDLGWPVEFLPDRVVVQLVGWGSMVFTRSHSRVYRHPDGVTLTIWSD